MWSLKPRYVSCIDHQTLHLPSRPPPSDSELRTNEISHNKTACDRAGPNLRHTCSVKLGPVFLATQPLFSQTRKTVYFITASMVLRPARAIPHDDRLWPPPYWTPADQRLRSFGGEPACLPGQFLFCNFFFSGFISHFVCVL